MQFDRVRAIEQGHADAAQAQEIEEFKSAFDCFVEAACEDNELVSREEIDDMNNTILPEFARVGDLEGYQGRMLLFLIQHDCIRCVKLHNLKSRPELNGRYGKLCGNLQPDPSNMPARSRWPIEVDFNVGISAYSTQRTGQSQFLKVKTANLRPMSLADTLGAAAANLSIHQSDDPRAPAVIQKINRTVAEYREEEAAIEAGASAQPTEEEAAIEAAHAAFLEMAPSTEHDALTDELARCDEGVTYDTMRAQLTALLRPLRAVRLDGLRSQPALNGRDGLLVGEPVNGRHRVRTGGQDVRVRPRNLRPVPPGRAACVEVGVTPRHTARAAMPIRAAPEPLPIVAEGHVEAAEIAMLRQSRGWARPQGLKGYSMAATYPDLYAYFDAASTAPANAMVHAAFSAYPNDGMPAGGIRGTALLLRLKPPTAIDNSGRRTVHAAVWSELISFDEVRDTLEMYDAPGMDATKVARTRDMNRLYGDAPPEVLARMSGQHLYMGPAGPAGYGIPHPVDYGQ